MNKNQNMMEILNKELVIVLFNWLIEPFFETALVTLFLSGKYTLLTKIAALARMTVSRLHNSFGQLKTLKG